MQTNEQQQQQEQIQIEQAAYDCRECERSFPTKASLAMHILRAHRGVGPQRGSPMSSIYAQMAVKAKADKAKAKAKADKAKAKAKAKASASAQHEVQELCFCPRCGLNLQATATAMTVALRHAG